MARVLGPELGSFIRSVHEQHGVTFHLGRTAVSIDEHAVTLDNRRAHRRRSRRRRDRSPSGDSRWPNRPASPSTAECWSTSSSRPALEHVFAAGDIARWPDPHSGEAIRVEHFVVAERQGQTAARNMLGRREPFDAVPFFWTEQHDLSIAYVGHAEKWDEIVIDGSIEGRDCAISYLQQGPQASGGAGPPRLLRDCSPNSSSSSRFNLRTAAEPPASYRRWPEVINRSIAASNVGSSARTSRPKARTARESWWTACGRAGSARRKPGSTNGSRRSRRAPSCAHGSAMTRGAGTSSAAATARSSPSIRRC